MKAGPILRGEEMSQRIYMIRRAFLIPLGVDAFLLFCLLLISLLPQGSATERLVFTIFFLPTLYLFIESLFRRVTMDEAGIRIRKLWRGKRISWGEITHVGCLNLHKKVYILLTTVKGFFIVSNAYEGFPELVDEIVGHVDLEKVEEDVRLQTGRSLAGIAHVILAWVAAVLMIGIILVKVAPFFI
ncbi:MAG: hypothetical protein ABIJ57_08575 [Pseudomonadota bacterium]|nr:hypothetical protein [Pseudomonadota bacterium]MBU1184666.1 hypothetical protein [Pseudomonadota bacterium]MBU2252121.1 hypothetical protein [Pseudomonadota bacterium]MBU3932221.1 hypothetical protein [Pseudomonadota bacterium]MBU4120475.1 hypothetical protein [Pseudomonadota bacterium]